MSKAKKVVSSDHEMLLYADENFYFPVVRILRQQGHDVLTAIVSATHDEDFPALAARIHAALAGHAAAV